MKWVQKQPVYETSVFDDIHTQLAAINGIEDVQEFLYPTNHSLHSPYLLNNIDKARDMIVEAVKTQKQISILSDVDCDGVCSASIIYRYIKNFTENVQYFYEQRSAGHGIQIALDKLPDNTDFLIIVDSSSSDADACRVISEKGIPIVIIDHHPLENENPFALIVNPQIDDYPNKQISGATLCWKMCQVLDDHYDTNYHEDLVDLAAVGLYADTMSMRELENRFIVYRGLTNFRNYGLGALLKAKNRSAWNMACSEIGYTLAPMINGAARMDKIELVLEILTCDDPDRCKELAKEIKKENEKRQKLQKEYVQKVSHQVNDTDSIVIIIDEEISKGFQGLIAADLAKKHQKPAIVISTYDEVFKGSYRTYADFDLKSFFESLDEPTDIGGHDGAGGITIPIGLLEKFRTSVNKRLISTKKEKVIEYDIELDVCDIDESLIEQVEKFTRINGKHISEVKFKINGLWVANKKLSKKKDTVTIICDDLDIVRFRTDENFYNNVPVWNRVEAVGTLHLNRWYNFGERKQVISKQLFFEDFRVVG